MESWPSGVPMTLWNYRAIQAQDLPQIPMMGVSFTREFLVAFGVGFIFLIYVAWKRFKERETPIQGFRYRVMTDVAVADLGGAAAMRRAYLIYVTTLLFLYVAVAFFGKLIVQTVNGLNLVGIQVDDAALAFDSAQWPLTLAFGFAGLAPLVPQLQAAEDWLFRRAYRAVGIPVRIHQTTRNLLDLIARGKADAVPEMKEEIEKRKKALVAACAGKWVAQSVSPTREDRALNVLAQLELLVDLARGERGSWPGAQITDSVRDLERAIVKDAESLRYEFDISLKAAPAVEMQESFLEDLTTRARDLRDQLVAVLAVYVERDPDYVVTTGSGEQLLRVKHEGFRRVLEEADPPNLAGSGPELGVLTTIAVSFLLYMLFIWKGGHWPLSPRLDKAFFSVIVVSAGWEALKLLSIFWLPLLAAFAMRQHYCDQGTWVAASVDNPSLFVEQRFVSVALAFFVSVLCLAGVAALAAFFPAQSVTAFRNNLFGASPPFILFYPSMAFVTVPLVLFALDGADTRAAALAERGAEAAILVRRARRQGVLCAVVVLLCYGEHLRLWYGGLACTSDGLFLLDLFTTGCFPYYGGLDFFVMAVLSYLAVAMFGKPHAAPVRPGRAMRATPAATPPPDPAAPGAAAGRLVVTGTGVAPALAVLAVLLAAPAFSQSEKHVVRVGFRADAEPFSYRVAADGGRAPGAQPLYRGFLADLCYWIFDGGDYVVQEVPVTAADRFELLVKGRNDQEQIDVLCDPVTMRFSESDQRADKGVFSPIVFATGISYLRRRAEGVRARVDVAYVRATTAASVAAHTCKVDLFSVVVAEEERAALAQMCVTAGVALKIAELEDKPLPLPILKAGRAAAERELKTTEEWQKNAPPQRQTIYAAAIDTWTKAVDGAKACTPYRPDCDFSALKAAFAGDCTAVPPRADGWQPTIYRFCPMNDHKELIDWFCGAGKGGADRVYLGDREIILGKLRTWNERHTVRCSVESETAAEDLTYEPYALMTARVSSDDTAEKARWRSCIAELVQRRVYEFFSFGALARAKFEVYFGADKTMSTPLAYLFLLNGVEEERLFTFPQENADAQPPAPAPVCGAA